ncbi:MAG TPA: peptidoglycan DD-metalloendopeptidase family protein [Steroidobacteraceae bacterium]|nr:peptidoglycan DD-metalloendopeptidase family protein [Steroidobacteraceae bacterium]
MASELEEPIHTSMRQGGLQKRGRSIPSTHDGRRWVAIGAALLCALPIRAADPGKRAQTEAQLKAVQAEIARIEARVTRDQVETNNLARRLRSAELSVGAAREALERLRSEHAERTRQRAELAAERREHEARIDDERATLARELRAAYLAGSNEPLKLLLNQQDPARVGRMFAYYGYLGRARAEELARVEADVQQLDQLDAQLAGEEQHLAELETAEQSELDRMEAARADRRAALASLESEERTRAQRLLRLQREQAGLESLVEELRRAIDRLPRDTHDAFSRLRGKLSWPVSGRVAASFGQSRAGAVKWDGVLIDTQRGAPVRAVSGGRVIFADWLPGLGLLMIIDHGGGYLSLYGHNERLYKTVGEQVAAGDAIAAAGDTGGSANPALYFEIRKGDRPIDPLPWFNASVPARAGPHGAPAR